MITYYVVYKECNIVEKFVKGSGLGEAMSSSPFKASKITGAGPISASPSGYFARGIPVPRSVKGSLEIASPNPVFDFT